MRAPPNFKVPEVSHRQQRSQVNNSISYVTSRYVTASEVSDSSAWDRETNPHTVQEYLTRMHSNYYSLRLDFFNPVSFNFLAMYTSCCILTFSSCSSRLWASSLNQPSSSPPPCLQALHLSGCTRLPVLQCGIATMWVICSSLHVSANVTESNKYNLGVVQIIPLNCPKSLIVCDQSVTIN